MIGACITISNQLKRGSVTWPQFSNLQVSVKNPFLIKTTSRCIALSRPVLSLQLATMLVVHANNFRRTETMATVHHM